MKTDNLTKPDIELAEITREVRRTRIAWLEAPIEEKDARWNLYRSAFTRWNNRLAQIVCAVQSTFGEGGVLP